MQESTHKVPKSTSQVVPRRVGVRDYAHMHDYDTATREMSAHPITGSQSSKHNAFVVCESRCRRRRLPHKHVALGRLTPK